MKEKHYLILDCETATLDFVNDLANNENDKKTIAIAKPLIYDIGWIVTNRKGDIIKQVQYLVSEVFSVPAIFNTAYYAEKKPIYLNMLKNEETSIQPWSIIVKELINDMNNVEAVGAYNSLFDFKKAIPFTDLYINKLYSNDFYSWYNMQKKLCQNLLESSTHKKNENFNPKNFSFHGIDYPLFDLWGMAVTHLLDRVTYKKNCLKNKQITASGVYFKTSAETTYQYLCKQYDFVESHTALDDAKIETYIFSKIAMRHRVTIGIEYFPFKKLGYTDEFVMNSKKINVDYILLVINTMTSYVNTKNPETHYAISMNNRIEKLKELAAGAILRQ